MTHTFKTVCDRLVFVRNSPSDKTTELRLLTGEKQDDTMLGGEAQAAANCAKATSTHFLPEIMQKAAL